MGKNIESRPEVPYLVINHSESPEQMLNRAVELTAENRRIKEEVEEAGGLRKGESWPSNYVVNKIAIVLLVGQQGAQGIEAMLEGLAERAKRG